MDIKSIKDTLIEKISEAFKKEFQSQFKLESSYSTPTVKSPYVLFYYTDTYRTFSEGQKPTIKIEPPIKIKLRGRHYAFVLFPYIKIVKKNPEEIGKIIGKYLQNNTEFIESFNVINGYLNIEINTNTWIKVLKQISNNNKLSHFPKKNKKVMIEFSSPNTNKPLHLGHLRNNFLGYSLANIMEANGYEVMKTNLVNDRGIHICKSMLAYMKLGNNEQPSKELKGDKLVGKYYVLFENEYKRQIKELIEVYQKESPEIDKNDLEKKAERNAPWILEVKEIPAKMGKRRCTDTKSLEEDESVGV